MGIQIRVANRTKYKMLPMLQNCSQRLQAKLFQLHAHAHTLSTLSTKASFYRSPRLGLSQEKVYYNPFVQDFSIGLFSVGMFPKTLATFQGDAILGSSKTLNDPERTNIAPELTRTNQKARQPGSFV